MRTRKKLYYLFIGILFYSCKSSNQLTVAFANESGIWRGVEIINHNVVIGQVIKIETNKIKDTLLTTLRLVKKCRIPKGSKFILEPVLIGNPWISVEYSDENKYLNSKDISIGITRNLDSLLRRN